MIEFKDDDDKFLSWTRANARGFVLAVRTRHEAMLHAAGCSHLTEFYGTSAALTKKAKMCADDSGELRKWASDNGVKVISCSDC